MMIKKILRYFGFFKYVDLTHDGNCGCCGKYIYGTFDKEWTWGICEECQVYRINSN